MRVAFVSCFSAQMYQDSPAWTVWDEIAASQPDVLVLLGDSIYLDCGGPYAMGELKGLTEYAFAQHMHGRFGELLAAPGFRELVARPDLAVHAIWDDHDFLWDNACGVDVARDKSLRPLVYVARAQFAAFRRALAAHLAPGSYPAQPDPWLEVPPPPGYSCVPLTHDCWLHLTDGRSFKKGRGKTALMGMAQLDSLQAHMQAAPAGTVHLVASGVVFEGHSGESWLDCRAEYDRMLSLAEQHNILVLSGDIHDNNLAAVDLPSGRRLFEATSSGAALRRQVVAGSLLRNFGLLDVTADRVQIRLHTSGVVQYAADLDRANWR